jgi:tRNA modification GTPase
MIEQSDAVLVVNDASMGIDHSDSLVQDVVSNFPGLALLIVQNKVDVVVGGIQPRSAVEFGCSARSGDGLMPVRNALLALVQQQTSQSTDVLVNARQATLLLQVSSSLSSALDSLSSGRPSDLMAVDIRSAIRLLGDISGESWNPDVLDTVFSRFCIGK